MDRPATPRSHAPDAHGAKTAASHPALVPALVAVFVEAVAMVAVVAIVTDFVVDSVFWKGRLVELLQ